MHHALLLSPDDQAVSAITAVLEEMSVTCERPLDGPSAAKKLNSQSFDLVLVDCENLPAAKLIFDVCRRSMNGGNPVPIAIVDGRAGLPTAFRLGAELILTKPVAKDQARTTIRTAVSRVRKDDAAKAIHPFEQAPSETAQPTIAETHAHAAAAGALSATAGSESIASASAVSAAAKMSFATEAAEAPPPATKRHPASSIEKPAGASSSRGAIAQTEVFMPAAKAANAPSEDPVLADLESDTPTPVFSSYVEPKKKSQGALIALLVLLLAGGGLYAAWMYQPGFREIAQPQVDRLLGMIGSLGSQHTPSPQPEPVPVKPPVSQPAPVIATPASDAPANATATNTASPSPASTGSTIAEPPSAITTTANGATAEPSKEQTPGDSKKSTIAALPIDSELPGEKTAVILSSQGAEKRLIRHIQPAYPADARKAGIEGTVVLKTVVSEAGVVEGVRLVEGNPALAAAAIVSVKQWHYRPYVRDGKAQPFQTIVLVEFQRP